MGFGSLVLPSEETIQGLNVHQKKFLYKLVEGGTYCTKRPNAPLFLLKRSYEVKIPPDDPTFTFHPLV